jgi:hypothetical protein
LHKFHARNDADGLRRRPAKIVILGARIKSKDANKGFQLA